MPIGSHGNVLHDFAAIRLHAVQILDANAKQGAAQPIVDARHKGFLVLPLLESRDHVSIAIDDRRDESRNVLGKELQVGGIEHENAAARMVEAGAERVGNATSRAVLDGSQKWIGLTKRD